MPFLKLIISRIYNEQKWNWMFTVLYSIIIYGICSAQPDYFSKVKPILDKLDYTVNPCEDFYEYVCGHLKTSEIPTTLAHIDLFQRIFDKTATQLIELASEDINPDEPKIYQLIKTFYKSCMDSKTIEDRGLQPLQRILNALGGWPVLLGDSWNEKGFTWEQTDRTLKSLGYNPKFLFHIDVMKDQYDTSKNILCISESETLVKDLRHYDYLLDAYKEYMVNVALLFGANEDIATRELNEAFLFELKLWSISHYAIEGISETMFNRLTIAELQDRYPYVQWFEYLNFMTFPQILSESNSVCIENPTYLHAIQGLLTNTSRRVIANYMVWRAIDASAKILNEEMRDTRREFSRTFYGITGARPDHERCIKMMMNKDNALLPGISAMYLKHYFQNDTREKVTDIVSMFKETYENIVQKSWLDDGTKVRALRKIALMKNMIGFPDELLDLDFIDNYYKNLYLKPNEFFENSMLLRNFLYENNISNLKKSPNDTFWLYAAGAALVDAHYDVLHNAMIISASLIQYPIFDENQPDYMNYGNFGTILGHEITHALTFGEFPWDEYGSKMRWWTTCDQNEYVTRAECFLKQFQNHTNDEYIARQTLGENVADTEAVKIGFKAYKTWKEKKGEKGSMQFLNHTDEQLYWISTAYFMCAKTTTELTNLTLFTDTHATEKLRVNMGLANSADFSRCFSCPIGSQMNPAEKCSFW